MSAPETIHAPNADDATNATGAPASTVTRTNSDVEKAVRQRLQRAGTSYASVPPDGHALTGKQEHYLKRELLSQQVKYEIAELASPTALQRFGAPFRSDAGEVPPEDSELPILRYVFVHHVRNFPFLDQAKEKEFWQDKLQIFLESFANKHISSSEDRLEDTKRKKLANKAEKLMELMMVSGVPTASGYEERIRFSEMEVVDRSANEQGLVANAPHGQTINGWDVNVAGVSSTLARRHVRYHETAQFIIRVKESGHDEIYISRTYEDFRKMHKRLRLELPGKILPPLPRQNSSDQTITMNDISDDDSFMSANSTKPNESGEDLNKAENSAYNLGGFRSYLPAFGGSASGPGHKRSISAISEKTHRPSGEFQKTLVLFRETSRVSLRAALRTMLGNDRTAQSTAMREFLTRDPISLTDEQLADIEKRQELDEKRIKEQKQFYEVARARAAELDVHMEKFRRDIVENNGLTHLFEEIKEKKTLKELSPEYIKFAEWVRIEVAATLYHLFLAEDNSPELFSQLKRIHSLVPYSLVKNVVRFSNPATVMSGILDIFLLQPFGARSLLQRIFGMAINDGIVNIQKSIEILASQKVQDHVLSDTIRQYAEADEEIKNELKLQALQEKTDLLVVIFKSNKFGSASTKKQIDVVFDGYQAWNRAMDNIDDETRQNAELFAHLKQLLKLYMRQRDKVMMLQMIEEPNTLRLFRDLFQIFYEPLVRVYKSANVYNSIMDFAAWIDDTIKTVEAAQRQDFSADPNQTVQAFIDLCARHEANLYKFIHEVHTHDNGLFVQLMGWLEGILAFLKFGPRGGKLDMNRLFIDAVEAGTLDPSAAIREINALIKWQMARKRWHIGKTRQKMAADGGGFDDATAMFGDAFKSSDFGINEMDLADLDDDSSVTSSMSDGEDDDDYAADDPIAAERNRRAKQAEREKLRRSAGEPSKPPVGELDKLLPDFVGMLRQVFAK
ncbi:hypothetical protein BT63DRAFT_396105 [Microthyrium microscopicum]|uniref:PX domain-containing protein n=1 Tax=Microthyrium microscopicum TaxID=703497 RepID=A0A6A6UTJ7_9PEZI|nr:hypothetical protein BT63DRAFT_396105 [Microthyrium microscopicum]